MENEELVSQFQAITNEPSDRARFYLEAVNWDLNVALSSFYENSGDADEFDQPMLDVSAGGASNVTHPQHAEKDPPQTHDKKVG